MDRELRYGRCLDLIITDQHSYRNADPFSDPSLDKLGGEEFIDMFPESGMRVLDGGKPQEEIRFNDAHVPNPQRNAPPQTILGAAQKAWFKDKLRNSTAVWKIWGTRRARWIRAPTLRTCRRASPRSRGPSRAAKDRTAAPSDIGYCTPLRCGRAGSGRN